MYCPYCGAELPDDARFCIKCEKDLSGLNESSKTTTEEPEIQKLATSVTQPKKLYSTILENKNSGFDTAKKGKSIASFVLGVLCILSTVPIGWGLLGIGWGLLGIGWGLLGIIGIIIGVVSLIEHHGIKWMAIVGIILSVLSLVAIILIYPFTRF